MSKFSQGRRRGSVQLESSEGVLELTCTCDETKPTLNWTWTGEEPLEWLIYRNVDAGAWVQEDSVLGDATTWFDQDYACPGSSLLEYRIVSVPAFPGCNPSPTVSTTGDYL